MLKKINKKLSIIFALIFLLVLIVGFFIFFKIKKSNNPAVPIDLNINQSTSQDRLINQENDLLNFNQAQEKQDLNLCGSVKDGQLKSDCSAMVLLKRAELSQNITDCFLIEQLMFKKTCIERLAEANKKIDCNLIPDLNLKNTCLSIIYYQQAKDENNAKICDQIPGLIRRANCLSELQKIDLHSDVDQDGLDFLQEILNNTDPNNPDTDGDGFKDGDEVKGGFNPDGEGVLNEIKPLEAIACLDIKDELIKAICLSELKGKPLDLLKCAELKDSKLKQFCLEAFKLATAVK